MRKLFCFVSAFFLCLALSACGDEAPCVHTFKIAEITDATCEQTGSLSLQCSLCGVSFVQETPTIGHNYIDANCTTAQCCTQCGKTKGQPLGHDWADATCATAKTCKTCGEVSGKSLGHNYSAATCTDAEICATCGNVEGAPLGHDWTDASCLTPETCNRCGEESGSALGHRLSDATCTTPQTCTACGITEGEPNGHDWVEATCTAPKTCNICAMTDGEKTEHSFSEATCSIAKTCVDCGTTEGEPTGHDWNDATCTTPQACLTCGMVTGEALGHSYYSVNIKKPTCCDKGQMEYICRRCAHNYIEKYEGTGYTATQIYDEYKKTVGEIITYDEHKNVIGIGSCIVYTSEGHLVTNYHVIEGAYSAQVEIDGKIYPVQNVLAFDKFIDIAIVQIDAKMLKPAVWCEYPHAAGTIVYALGSSYGLTLSLSQGIVSYATREINGVKYVQHSAPISEGNSGGALINEYGEVIGINTMSLLDAQNINFAIQFNELSKITWKTMTMQEFYNYTKESDPFLKMKNFIIAEGEYDKENKCYQMLCNYAISIANQNYAYRTDRIACYFEEEDIIALSAVIVDTNGEQYCLVIVISPDVTGVYEWRYYDTFGGAMAGVLEAGAFAKSSVLEYTFTNIEKENTRDDTRNLATRLAKELLEAFNSKFQKVGMTVKDLGFLKY